MPAAQAGEMGRAKELFRESLAIRQRQLGAAHAESLETGRHLEAMER